MVEVQEPADLSVTLEWTGFEIGEEDGHLGLGFPRVLEALDRSAWSPDQLSALWGPGRGRSLLPAAADAYFRAERVRGGDTLDAGFSVLVGTGGDGTLGSELFGRGSAMLIPHAAGDLELSGSVDAIRCRPPEPTSEEGE